MTPELQRLMELNQKQKLTRQPFVSEMGYFASNPAVAGMMTPDQRVTMPPDIRLGRSNVELNETIRLLLQKYSPQSSLTEQQKQFFQGTPYATDEQNALRSIIARAISGDPSAKLSFEQDAEVRRLLGLGGMLSGLGGK
jgi:hypothetical protein